MTEVQPIPASLPAGEDEPSSPRIARSLRDNALRIFPPEAFEQEVFRRRIFGRRQIIMNRASGIQHILVDNWSNYRRTTAAIRILRPLLGQGLLLSQGEDWRRQRRSLAPAFAPRTIPVLTHHIVRAANVAVAKLSAAGATPVDLLAAMQFLAPALQETLVGRVADQRVPETIGRIWRRAFDEEKIGSGEAFERGLEAAVVDCGL